MNTTFAERLKNAMEQADMSQAELSLQSGASKAAISQYLSGKNTPGPERVKALADATGTTFDFLMGYGGAPAKDAPPPVKKISVKEAARCMGKSDQFVRIGLQRGLLPFGNAVPGTGNNWNYYIMVITTGTRHAGTDMFNTVNADIFGAFNEATMTVVTTALGFDAFVDGAAMLNLENLENVSIFGFVHPTDVAKLRKALKEDLKYVEAFAKQGYVGTVGGINIYTKKNADPGKVVIGTKEAVTLFNKKGTEVEQEREGNIRKNTVYSRKYYLAAMTNEAKAVKIIVGSAKTTADETVQSKKVYYKPSGIGYVVGTPKTNPKTEGFYEITAA